MRGLTRGAWGSFVFAAMVIAGASSSTVRPDDARARRLDELQEEMKRIQGEMAGLAAREKGLLGDVARLDAEIALRRAQLEEVTLRLRGTQERLDASQREIETIQAERARRAPQLAARLREMYKRGSVGLIAGLAVPLGTPGELDGFRYASYLSHRDARQLAAWRDTSKRLGDERAVLSAERTRWALLRADDSRKEQALSSGRAARASLLARVRGDREQREKAFGELADAAKNLGRLVESIEDTSAPVGMDVRKFRGLLDWPAEGAVSARFGSVVHPRFKTAVPHPGLDIDAPEGQPFRAVFDGRVAFAAPLNGYGLTVVVDHGHGIVSIYAHASVLLVEAGQVVARGQSMGRVGESGSLRGPYLYFEVREAGKPVDPIAWMRRR